MKSFIVFALMVAAVAAAPQSNPADVAAQVVRQELNNIGVEGYNFAVETSNGIKQQEEGQLQNVGTENEAISVRGQYSYTGPDGILYTVTYIANEDGFQPQGAHIPQAA